MEKKVINFLKYENGFLVPIKIFPGPQGGAYAPFEIPMVFDPQNPDWDIDVIVYEIKKVETKKMEDFKKDKK